jgi:hypothetical protein
MDELFKQSKIIGFFNKSLDELQSKRACIVQEGLKGRCLCELFEERRKKIPLRVTFEVLVYLSQMIDCLRVVQQILMNSHGLSDLLIIWVI